MLLNSISFDLHCVLFTFSNNCGTFGISQMIEKKTGIKWFCIISFLGLVCL